VRITMWVRALPESTIGRITKKRLPGAALRMIRHMFESVPYQGFDSSARLITNDPIGGFDPRTDEFGLMCAECGGSHRSCGLTPALSRRARTVGARRRRKLSKRVCGAPQMRRHGRLERDVGQHHSFSTAQKYSWNPFGSMYIL
jgi:hypothetical protein